MGIYGALSSAVTGLRAQAHALENISGNIANSQTTGYKRIETDFLDLIPDAPIKRQVPGAVLAQSRGTNDVQGDIRTVSNETFIALNSNGFFVVEPKIGQSDGNSVFAGTNFFTRRGDFEIDKDGMMVNGAGYYLKGLPIDPTTGNISGSVPGVIELSNAFLAARQSTTINYAANLPQLPKTTNYSPAVPNSELLRAADYTPGATFTEASSISNAPWGAAVTDLAGDSLTISVGGTPFTYHFRNGGTIPANNAANMYIDISAASPTTDTTAEVAAAINAHMQGRTGASGSSVTINGAGRLVVAMPAGSGTSLAVSGQDNGGPAVAYTTTPPLSSVPQGTPINAISADNNKLFEGNSVYGGATTLYAANGAPADVTLRWAKVNSPQATNGAADTWHLYYMSNSNAVGAETKWTRVNESFQFGANGSLASPADGSTTLTGLTVNGVVIGDVELEYGNGMSQFADVNGTANVSENTQDGYAAGQFVSVAINDNGRVVATYSNGKRIDMAQVVTAEFNAINKLKRLDGGVFASTSESGEALFDISGSGIMGGALEASNTDISDEFTKLIVTQQAYSAGTRIVSAADDMLKEALNMIR